MKAYKLTDQKYRTRTGCVNELTWGEGIEHSVDNTLIDDLCSPAWIHYYSSPLIAVLVNPVHANIQQPILWECITYGKHKHETLKHGCKKLKTIRQIKLPEFTNTNKIAFAIFCACQVYKDPDFIKWADDWINNIDRNKDAADAAANAANAAAYAAYAAANAANAAANAAYVATHAANAAVNAADAADACIIKIDFIKLAKASLKIK